MKEDSKVNYYFNKIDYYGKNIQRLYNRVPAISINNKEDIKEALRMIIMNNKEHLLTNSLLIFYVAETSGMDGDYSKNLLDCLNRLNIDNPFELIESGLYRCYESLFYEINNKELPNNLFVHLEHKRMLNSLNEDEKSIKRAFEVDATNYLVSKCPINGYFIVKLLLLAACYGIYMNDIKYYRKIAKSITSDTKVFYDELLTQGLIKDIFIENKINRVRIPSRANLINYLADYHKEKKLIIE